MREWNVGLQRWICTLEEYLLTMENEWEKLKHAHAGRKIVDSSVCGLLQGMNTCQKKWKWLCSIYLPTSLNGSETCNVKVIWMQEKWGT